jgi:hypothetical protein
MREKLIVYYFFTWTLDIPCWILDIHLLFPRKFLLIIYLILYILKIVHVHRD